MISAVASRVLSCFQVRISQSFLSLEVRFRWRFWACLWFPSPRDEGVNHMVKVLIETSSWQDDVRCGEEQGSNEIVGGGTWSSCTGEVMQ
ncbi:hypothetical protein TIFTF001_005404 [Ficus carica]|uniref:Uncharacterized protein n=1 Tax=Ficus carica TaxID=3494 RepID=A0AA87ZJI5_FICCA|nr:hypothetical protein TIFTF001_005404 [Ficus carica]